MLSYEFFCVDQRGEAHLIGIIPERRKHPGRITKESVMQRVWMLLGDSIDLRYSFVTQVIMDEGSGRITGGTPLLIHSESDTKNQMGAVLGNLATQANEPKQTKYLEMARKDNVVEKKGIFDVSYVQRMVKVSDPILQSHKHLRASGKERKNHEL